MFDYERNVQISLEILRGNGFGFGLKRFFTDERMFRLSKFGNSVWIVFTAARKQGNPINELNEA